MNATDAIAALARSGETYVKIFSAAEYDVGLYKPVGTDPQDPHLRDEVYIVVSGSGTFLCNGEERPFGPGDMLPVEAGADHRFLDFTPDFATWVVFFGAVPRK